jgi:hypothetical protein
VTLHADMIANDIQREGSPAVLSRFTGTSGIHYDVNVYAVERGYKPEQISGEIKQGDRECRISNREILAHAWPGPPRAADVLIMSGRNFRVMGVNVLEIGGEVVEHVLQVRG